MGNDSCFPQYTVTRPYVVYSTRWFCRIYFRISAGLPQVPVQVPLQAAAVSLSPSRGFPIGRTVVQSQKQIIFFLIFFTCIFKVVKVLKTGIFYNLQEVWEQILAAQVFHLFWPCHGTLTKQKYHLSTVCLNGDQIQLSFSAPTASHLGNALTPPASLFLSNAFPGNTTSCNIQRQTGMPLESSAYVERGTPMKPLASNVHKCLAPSHFWVDTAHLHGTFACKYIGCLSWPLKTAHYLKPQILHLQYCRCVSKWFVSIYLGSSMSSHCIQTPTCKSETSLRTLPLDLVHTEYGSHLCSIKAVAKCHNALIHR